ncbi:MAG: hypothetical protein AB7G12_05970 [Thermoanaerobaculia bacterium]
MAQLQLYDIDPLQPLSAVLGGYIICHQCDVVGRFGAAVPWPCPACGVENVVSRAYFPMQVLSLVDLMQQQRWLALSIGGAPPWANKGAELATVNYFCALQEALLRHLLKRLMVRKGLANEEQRDLFDKARGRRRMAELFQTLTAVPLDRAVAELEAEEGWEFLGEVAKARNGFLHSGIEWSGPLAPSCVNEVGRLLKLFVELHNRYLVSVGLAPGASP